MEIFTANKPRLILTYIRKKHFGKTIGVLYHSVIDGLPWSKTGQIAHVSSPFSGIAQKIIFARHTAEATRGLGMGCWC